MMEPSAANNSDFKLYIRLYNQALPHLAAVKSTIPKHMGKQGSTDNHSKERIMVLLDAMSRVIFGLDTKMKESIVTYGIGTIELILSLIKTVEEKNEKDRDTDDQTDRSLLLSTLKVIKTCVIKNPVGRSRCRSAGVIPFLHHVLQVYLHDEQDASPPKDRKRPKNVKDESTSWSESSLEEIPKNRNLDMDVMRSVSNEVLIDEALTTLAAICLGDDLNAYQASVETSALVDLASQLYKTNTSLIQKTTYLTALFSIVVKEQEAKRSTT